MVESYRSDTWVATYPLNCYYTAAVLHVTLPEPSNKSNEHGRTRIYLIRYDIERTEVRSLIGAALRGLIR